MYRFFDTPSPTRLLRGKREEYGAHENSFNDKKLSL